MITNKDISYFNSAKNMAHLSNFKRIKIGCVIVYRNKIISTGVNSEKTHPKQKEYNVFRFKEDSVHKLHAETNALLHIRYLDINWSKVKVYVYREFKNGSIAPSRPCESCYNLIKDMNIKQIYYTTENGYACEIII